MQSFLKDFTDFIKAEGINIYGVAVVDKEGLVLSERLVPCNPCQNSYSVSKFFTLTAIGMLWDEGRIDTEEKLTDILKAHRPKDIDPKWDSITVDMAIRHHCGLEGGCLDIDCQDIRTFGEDFLGFVFWLPLGNTEEYAYTDAAFYLLGRAVAERAHMPLCEFLWKELFLPLEVQEAAWSVCPRNHAMGATGLYIRTEDMVKLGALYLNGGVYKGKRLLSEKWIETVLERGYLHPCFAGGFGHGGMLGQMLGVLPKQGFAVAWHGYHDEGETVNKWIDDYFKNKGN